MRFSKPKNNQNGLTLVEILVTVGIMLTISTIVFLSRGTVSSTRNVKMSAYRLASEIRKMQSYTLNLQNFQGSGYPSGGWGIHLDKSVAGNTAYNNFADLDEPPDHNEDAGENFQEMKLPYGIKIKAINVGLTNTPSLSNEVYLVFEPPDPKTWICDGADCSIDVVEITLSDHNGDYEERVIVNKFGLIDVKN